MKIPNEGRIIIHEDTLREGEQAPGNTMTHKEKIEVAKDLGILGVDVVQAGFPVASEYERKCVYDVAQILPDTEVSALSRVQIPREGEVVSYRDIDLCAQYLEPANRKRLHMVVSTSEEQNQTKWPGIKLDDIIEIAVGSVRHTFEVFGPDVVVQFSAEDAGRTPFEDLIKVAIAVTDAGAHCVNIADTVGYAQPWEFGEKVRKVYEAVPRIRSGEAYISVHCHNRLGLAVANSLAGILNGARQVESSILGLGDTGGFASTESIVEAVKARPDIYGEGRFDHINSTHFFPTAERIRRYINMDTSRHNLVGKYSWSHESGMHASACIKGDEQGRTGTYDFTNPADLGWDGERYPVGKHSGWRQMADKLHELGYSSVDEQVAKEVQSIVSEIASKQKYIADHEIDGVMSELGYAPAVEKYKIESWDLHDTWDSEEDEERPATVTLRMSGPDLMQEEVTATGNGPVDAAVHAICKATGIRREMVDFNIHALTQGSGAYGMVDLTIRDVNGEEKYHQGMAIEMDTARAGGFAYVNALNRMLMYHVLKAV